VSEALSPRDCPRDGTTLVPVTVDGITVDVCHSCCGVWLEVGEFAALVRHPADFGEVQHKAEADRAESAGGAKGLDTCPNGHGPMTHYAYSDIPGIEIETCGTCHGVWVDDPMLPKIQQHLSNPGKGLTSEQQGLVQAFYGKHMSDMGRIGAWSDLAQQMGRRYGIFDAAKLIDLW
jgi:Zn-finger nucleic acid-binding protein